MTQAPAKQELWLFTGTVTAVNEKGLKLDAMGDDWINFTKAEWRGSWYDASKGEHVTIQCAKDKSGRYYIKTIVLDGHQDWSEPELPPTGAPTTNRDLSIIRQVCIKAAAEVVVALINREAYPDMGDLKPPDYAIDICAIAQDLERWAVRAE